MTTERDIAVEARHQLLEATEEGHKIELAFQALVCRCQNKCACFEDRNARARLVDGYPALSQVEIAILKLVAFGKSNEEIGNTVGVRLDTVKTHLRHIYNSMQARDRAHAVALGFRYGFLSHDMMWPEDLYRVEPPVAGQVRN